MGISGIIRYM